MTQMISDETLMAFADGELDAETEALVESALGEDDTLAERLAVFLDSRTMLATTMKPLVEEPVPAALQAGVLAAIAAAGKDTAALENTAPPEEKVAAFRPRQTGARAQRGLSSASMALAASLAALVVGLGGFMLGQSSTSGPEKTVVALNEALDTLPSGADLVLARAGESLHMVASFRDGEGHLCREYEIKARSTLTVAIACHGPEGWQTRLALTNPVAEGYVPASAPETVDAFLTGIGAGAPLSVDEEAGDMAAIRKN